MVMTAQKVFRLTERIANAHKCPPGMIPGELAVDLTSDLWMGQGPPLEETSDDDLRQFIEDAVIRRLKLVVSERRQESRQLYRMANDESDIDRHPIYGMILDDFKARLPGETVGVLEELIEGYSEREIAKSLKRTRHSIRGELARIKHAFETYLHQSE